MKGFGGLAKSAQVSVTGPGAILCRLSLCPKAS